MKIGLWNDDHNFPNLVTMKLSAYHKAHGDKVELLNHLNTYDLVYCSKVFDFTPDAEDMAVISADKILRAGTGYHDYTSKLPPEIENMYPDYTLYPQYTQAYCYLTRGCPRNCSFCCVTQKEGCISKQVADLQDGWHGQKEIKLLDPNLLTCKDHERILKQLADSKAWVDITQGFDIRLITPDNMSLINALKIRIIHFAWDNPTEDLSCKFQYFIQHTAMTKHQKPGVYVLTNFSSTHEQDLYRIYKLRELGYDPYVMIYNKAKFIDPVSHKMYPVTKLLERFTMDKIQHFKKCQEIQRWVCNRRIFASTDRFEEYDPKVG